MATEPTETLPIDAPGARRRFASPHYAITFAAIGLLGGALTGTFTPEKGWEPAFAAVTMIDSALLGFWLTTKRQADGRVAPARIMLGTLLAGAFNGLVLVAMMMPIGALLGIPIGALFSVPFMLAFLVLAACASGVGEAREGSILDRMHRRRHLAGAACLVAVIGTFLFVHEPRLAALRFVCIVASPLVALAIVALDVRDLRITARAAREGDGTPIPGDFGLGPDVVVPTPSEAPYRLTEGFVTIRRGDAKLVQLHLRDGLLTSAGMALITVGASAVGLLARTPTT